MRIIILVVQQW